MASELTGLRNEYKELAGKGASPRMTADDLRAKIAELKANPPAGNAPASPPAEPAAAKAAPKVKLVKMVRSHEDYPEGPWEADIHPDEVENARPGGWVEE